jgi:signal transduction histidine kinase
VALHRWAARHSRSPFVGYAAAVLVPAAATLIAARVEIFGRVFEQAMLLLVVAFALRWGMRVAAFTAIVGVGADDVLLRTPIHPQFTPERDVLDVTVFVAVAVIVGWLVTTAQHERRRAEAAATRERRARAERDRLIATVSHDLATPLGVIRGTLQFVRRRGSDMDDLPRLLDRLDTAAMRATSLVRTLADAQALDSGDLMLRLRPLDLREVVAPIAHMIDRLSDRHPVVLATPDIAVQVIGDSERLQRVVENLINNAIKYSPDGGAVEVALSMRDGQAILEVRDYGIGISPEALPHIFERSYRAPEAAATAPGLGLGLNISAQIVMRHGGNLQARPAEPRGAILTLKLPIATMEQKQPAHADLRHASYQRNADS